MHISPLHCYMIMTAIDMTDRRQRPHILAANLFLDSEKFSISLDPVVPQFSELFLFCASSNQILIRGELYI